MRVGSVSDCFFDSLGRFVDTSRLIELNQLTGIAAILTFPLDVEVVEAEEKAAKEAEAEAAAAADHEANGATPLD
jgi:hypothetical protein